MLSSTATFVQWASPRARHTAVCITAIGLAVLFLAAPLIRVDRWLFPAMLAGVSTAPLLAPHTYFLASIALVAFHHDWEVGGVRFDVSDLLFLFIAASLGFHTFRRGGRSRKPAYLSLVALYTAFVAISNIAVPSNRAEITGIVSLCYQLYRYSIKPAIYYVLAVVCTRDKGHLRNAVVLLILSADCSSVAGVIQGYAGARATGSLDFANSFGGFLILPLALTVALALSRGSLRLTAFSCLSLVIQLRALWFSGSRGAMAGFIVAFLCFCVLQVTSDGATVKLRRLLVGVMLGIAILAAAHPDFRQSHSFQRYATLLHARSQPNFIWRQKRWRQFWKEAAKHPLLGIGAGRLEKRYTAHNGYLRIAVKHGFPALLLFLACLAAALRAAHVASRSQQQDRWIGGVAAGMLAGLLGLCVENIVEASIAQPQVEKLFWLTFGLCIAVREAARIRERQPGCEL